MTGPSLPRIRQAVLVTTDLDRVVARLSTELGRWTEMPPPYRDPGVGQFGLDNAVLAVGDSFLEVLTPIRPDTAAGRHLDRRGGDAGYMVMLQVADMRATRRRLADRHVRVVWQVELPDAVDLHLHPHDVPGALVAVDTMQPPGSWRWGGPGFTGRAPEPAPAGGLAGLTVAVPDPLDAARRWAAVAGLPEPTDPRITLGGGEQTIEFVPATGTRAGLAAIAVALPGVGDQPVQVEVGTTSIEIRQLVTTVAGEETRHG